MNKCDALLSANFVPQYWGACASDEDVQTSSTSGGIASVLAEMIISRGGAVFGAAYDPFPRVRHIKVERIDDLIRIKGSKYVESDIRSALKDVKQCLREGRSVLFVGLPCHVAAVKSYVGNEKSSLLTADLICHGKPSGKLFERWIEQLERFVGVKIVDYSFRNKREGWLSAVTHQHEYRRFDGGISEVPPEENWYSRYFLGGCSFRECCYACQYARARRVGDLTLGDFWGCECDSRFSNWIGGGVSLVSVNSERGKDAIDACGALIRRYSVDAVDALRCNRQLTKPSKRNVYRNFVYRIAYLPRPLFILCDIILFKCAKVLKRILRRR